MAGRGDFSLQFVDFSFEVASPVVGLRLKVHYLQRPVGPGVLAQQLWLVGLVFCGMWNLPGTGIEPVSPTSAGGSLLMRPPRKSFVLVSAQQQKQSFIPVLTDWSYVGDEPCQ